MSLAKKKKQETCSKMMYNIPHLFKNIFQYQTANFNNEKLQLLLHQPNILASGIQN